MKQKSLNLLRQECENCCKCELNKTRNKLVFASGNINAKAILIGEAPGEEEDKSGLPFKGKAGQFLDEYLIKAGIDRENDLYIINTLKCRPVKINPKTSRKSNRPPTLAEKKACREFLIKQIEIINPKFLILCGNNALKTFCGSKACITDYRGKWFEPKEIRILSTAIFHPSYLAAYAHSEEKNSLFLTDLINIKNQFDLK